ncbi:GNAT family N-acetyltransferase [Dankookia rubra]|uniref:GNAT family N-acetyltransferase n=1 Tax=Dankookia rubra TaxID=1442381 RepID=A0A4R5Q6Y5_9PROT|nr:GNAT family N-acetyltransferase [Dankookia rubra]TDH58011.1 GNAT family N-acetyltransferase [Dankookia rubra]
MSTDVTPSAVIRPAGSADAGCIAALVQEAYTPWIAVIGRRPRPMDDDYEARCAKAQAWLLELDGEPVGAVIIEDMNGYLFLHNIAVAPRMQHRGFGRRLMHFVEEEARRRSFREVKLTTTVVMQKNIDLYERLGYAITGREPTATVDRVWMTKRVDEAGKA